jgi:DNA replicative helicase MCM subunit Mcm2 (Cdc46/Mcm family)
VNEEIDYKLSTFVINSHIQNHPYTQKYLIEDLPVLVDESREETLPYIEIKVLRQYIKYAREKCHPQLADKNL